MCKIQTFFFFFTKALAPHDLSPSASPLPSLHFAPLTYHTSVVLAFLLVPRNQCRAPAHAVPSTLNHCRTTPFFFTQVLARTSSQVSTDHPIYISHLLVFFRTSFSDTLSLVCCVLTILQPECKCRKSKEPLGHPCLVLNSVLSSLRSSVTR